MRKIIILVAVIVIVLLGASAVASHYQDQQNKEQAKVLTKEQQLANQLEAVSNENTLLEGKYQTERLNCEKGRVAFGYVPLNQVKAQKLQAPVCGQAVIR